MKEATDRVPIEKQLYHAAVIPLLGGGVYLYVRFHHVIIDGYGMSLFVQKVLDALMREIEAFSHRENVSVPYIVASAYAVYLAQASGKPDAVFLMPRLNRMPEQMNTLPCIFPAFPDRKEFDVFETMDPAKEVGGLGIYMVKKIMDAVFYEYKDGQNILRIKKNI